MQWCRHITYMFQCVYELLATGVAFIPRLHDTARLSSRFRFDKRVERKATVRSTGCQTGLYNLFDNRLYRVNGTLEYHMTKASFPRKIFNYDFFLEHSRGLSALILTNFTKFVNIIRYDKIKYAYKIASQQCSEWLKTFQGKSNFSEAFCRQSFFS